MLAVGGFVGAAQRLVVNQGLQEPCRGTGCSGREEQTGLGKPQWF